MIRHHRTSPLFMALAIAFPLATACEFTTTGTPAGGRTSAPGATTAATGTPNPLGSGNLTGGIGTGGSGSPTALPSASPSAGGTTPGSSVQVVTLAPPTVVLNVPATNQASASMEFNTYKQFAATVTFTDRAAGSNADVTWESSDAERVAIDANGFATVLSAAPAGTVEIRAIAKKDPARIATASITVTRNSEIEVVVD